jgi:hypothetical protein
LPKGEHQTRFSGTPSNLKEDDPLWSQSWKVIPNYIVKYLLLFHCNNSALQDLTHLKYLHLLVGCSICFLNHTIP